LYFALRFTLHIDGFCVIVRSTRLTRRCPAFIGDALGMIVDLDES
jgi:hypothetical protein